MGIRTVATGNGWDGYCSVCVKEILAGQVIVEDGQSGWMHENCWGL
jgi:hypothetical protein